eukprot:scaffold7675_cov277-Pinguiococcus_pyrenoidosus.AAC.9
MLGCQRCRSTYRPDLAPEAQHLVRVQRQAFLGSVAILECTVCDLAFAKVANVRRNQAASDELNCPAKPLELGFLLCRSQLEKPVGEHMHRTLPNLALRMRRQALKKPRESSAEIHRGGRAWTFRLEADG